MGASTEVLSPVSLTSSTSSRRLVLGWMFFSVFAGILALFPILYAAARGWMTDPLRSIGVALPVAALLFLFREFREFPGPWNGTAWGLLPIASAVAISSLLRTHVVQLSLSASAQVDPLPGGIAVSLFAAGLLLLIGGSPLLWRCLFPVVLFGITNPVPHAFSEHFDLPLQTASADAARGFAHLIGETPSGEQLRLMFTPDFGMFIAPGCNGIRGAVTLGYLCLFAAAWRRLRPATCGLFLAAGVVCGYLFNFLRLFVLVLYYRVGQAWPAIQPFGTQVDYAIGATLFLLASFALGSFVFRVRAATRIPRPTENRTHDSHLTWRLAACVVLSLAPAVVNLRALITDRRSLHPVEEASASLPVTVGGFRLQRQWFEHSDEGIPVYHWGTYSDGTAADEVSLGLWLPENEHDIRFSHASRGDVLEDMTPLAHTGPSGTSTYSAFRYYEGDTAIYLASLACRACRDVVPGLERTLGPLRLTTVLPVSYFDPPPGRSAILLHSSRAGTTKAALRRPLELFLKGLDERILFHEKERRN